jgi:hypothetical protein
MRWGFEVAAESVRAWGAGYFAGGGAADHSFHVLKKSGRNDQEVFAELAAATVAWAEKTAG